MSQSIRLRKLTEKSLLGFGRFADRTIGQMLSLRVDRIYLRWVYYNSSKITFMDNILDDLKIYPEFRIEKPGTSEEMFEKLKQKLYQEYEDNVPDNIKAVIKKKRKHFKEKSAGARIGACFETRGKMQARNQGRK